MKIRQALRGLSSKEFFEVISEGNEDVFELISKISIRHIFVLDDMNMRGNQIRYAYCDYCSSNLQSFLSSILSRDENMVNAVNIAVAKYEDEKHRAVVSGAINNRQFLSEDEVEILGRQPIKTKDGSSLGD